MATGASLPGEARKSGSSWSDAKTQMVVALIGAAAGIVTTLLVVYPQLKQIELQREELQLERTRRESAEARTEKAEAEVERYRRAFEEAPQLFARRLGDHISHAAEEGSTNLITNAKTIVSARNEFRGELETVGRLLNSEIDALEAELRKPRPDAARIQELVTILKQRWPDKADTIAVAIRKLFAEMGIVLESSTSRGAGLAR